MKQSQEMLISNVTIGNRGDRDGDELKDNLSDSHYTHSTGAHKGHDYQQQIISENVRDVSMQTIYYFLFFVCSMGVVTNVINIRVFLRQGLSSDSTAVLLFSLALADLAGCFFLLPPAVCYVIALFDYPRYLDCVSVTTMTCKLPHVCSAQITSWITVCVSVERALCVVRPLKVKEILRPGRAAAAVLVITAFFTLCHVPTVSSVSFVLRFTPTFNRNRILLMESALTADSMEYLFIQNNFILNTLSMAVVSMATMTIIIRLRSIHLSKNSHESAAPPASLGTSFPSSASPPQRINENEEIDKPMPQKNTKRSKEAEVVKTVVVMAILYLVCMSATHLHSFAFFMFPGFSMAGQNSNLFALLHSSRYIFDCINSSLNFFIYLRVSSKYRSTFYAITRKPET